MKETSGRDVPFPDVRQGSWAEDDEEDDWVLTIRGAEMLCDGEAVPYKRKTVEREDDGYVILLGMEDEADRYNFDRSYPCVCRWEDDGEVLIYGGKTFRTLVRNPTPAVEGTGNREE